MFLDWLPTLSARDLHIVPLVTYIGYAVSLLVEIIDIAAVGPLTSCAKRSGVGAESAQEERGDGHFMRMKPTRANLIWCGKAARAKSPASINVLDARRSLYSSI